MVLIGKIDDVIYYSRKYEDIPYELRKDNNISFECLHCKGKLTFINPHKRYNGPVMGHFRHEVNTCCSYEADIDRHLSIDISDFHKTWTSDIVKAEFLFGYWNKPDLYDIKNTRNEYIFVRQSLVSPDEIVSKEKYNEDKSIWILDLNIRQGTLSSDKNKLYFDFDGKVDIPMFSDKSKVYLDGGYNMLLEFIPEKPHDILGYHVSLVPIEKVFTYHFQDILRDDCIQKIIDDRKNNNIKVLNYTQKKKKTEDLKDYITYYTCSADNWHVKQGEIEQDVNIKKIPLKTYLMNGMKIINIEYNYIKISFPESLNAIDAFFEDYKIRFKEVIKYCDTFFTQYVDNVKKRFEHHRNFEIALNYHFTKNKNQSHDIAEFDPTTINKKILQSIVQVNMYNEVLSLLNNTCFFNPKHQKDLFYLSKYIKNSQTFINNPYAISCNSWYMDDYFNVLDLIAMKMNIAPQLRCISRIRCCLFRMQQKGDSCMAIENLCKNTTFVSHYSESDSKVSTKFIKNTIFNEHEREFFIYKYKLPTLTIPLMVYLKEVYYQELSIVNSIKDLCSQNSLYDSNELAISIPTHSDIDDIITEYETKVRVYEQKNNFEFDENQKAAVQAVFKSNFTLICGKPGTGKSDIVKAICLILTKKCNLTAKDILLCAPTGKAAAKLKFVNIYDENTQDIHEFEENNVIEPKTIDKALFDTIDFTNYYESDSDDDDNDSTKEFGTLPYKVVIADEVSMLDTKKCCAFLSNISKSTKVVLIGDHNQLPSIKYGDVLKSLVNSNVITNYVELIKVHRYGPKMQELANSILEGNKVVLRNSEDIHWYKTNDDDSIRNDVQQIYSDAINSNKSVLVIIPKKDNCYKLNTYLHNSFKPHYSHSNDFFIGERIICTKNNKHAMNGDFLLAGLKSGQNSEYKYRVFTSKEELENSYGITDNDAKFIEKKHLDYGYAITIHKSQGSEFDVVVIILQSKSHANMMYKNLLYTAVTRTKKTLHVFYDSENALHSCIKRTVQRTTCLPLILKTLIK